MMKQRNPLKKYFFNKSSLILLFLIVFFSFALYSYSFYEYSKVDMAVVSNAKAEISISEYNRWKRVSEVALIIFSVSASSLVSTLLIEKRNSNKIIEDVFVSDFFTSDKFINIMGSEQRKITLKLLEKNLYFNGCDEKSNMYSAIRNKIQNSVFDHDLIYNSYNIDVSCVVKKDFIEKKIVRTTSIGTSKKNDNIKDFVLLSGSFCIMEGVEPVSIEKLIIDGKTIDLNKIKKKEPKYNNILDHKKGYLKNIEYVYTPYLNFSRKKSIKITMEYVTYCPLSDKAYSCRLPYPCKKFDFKYDISNKDYRLIPYAFGFIDDAKDSPNHTEDKRKVSIKFEDWIFPLDGVCVYLEKI